MKLSRLNIIGSFLILGLITAGGARGFAQFFSDEAVIERETLSLNQGNVFEIIAVHSFSNARYNWVLTKEGQFLQGSQQPFFRVRLVEPGEYELVAEIKNDSSAYGRLFQILVENESLTETSINDPVVQTEINPETASITAPLPEIVKVKPLPDSNNRFSLTADQQIIQFWPLTDKMQAYGIDLDTDSDSNKDSDPTNDNDISDSSFSNATDPLNVWFVNLQDEHSLNFAAANLAGEIVSQLIKVYPETIYESLIEDEQEALFRPRIAWQPYGENSVQFFVENLSQPSELLLFHWQFGNGLQSILDNPVHQYEQPGIYQVLVKIQEITTGKELYSISKEIDGTPFVRPRSSSSAVLDPEILNPTGDKDDLSAGQNKEENNDGGFSFSLNWFTSGLGFIILIGAGILLAVIILGVILAKLLSSFRGGLMEKTLDKMEERLTGDEEKTKTEVIDVPSSARPAEKTEDITEPGQKETTEPFEKEFTPADEEYSLEQTPKSMQPISAPTSEPEVTKAPKPAEDVSFQFSAGSSPQETIPAASSPADEHVPDWLKQGINKDTETGQTVSNPQPAAPQDNFSTADFFVPPTVNEKTTEEFKPGKPVTEKDDDAVPAWLKNSDNFITNNETATGDKTAPADTAKQTETEKEKDIPDWLKTPAAVNTKTVPASPLPQLNKALLSNEPETETAADYNNKTTVSASSATDPLPLTADPDLPPWLQPISAITKPPPAPVQSSVSPEQKPESDFFPVATELIPASAEEYVATEPASAPQSRPAKTPDWLTKPVTAPVSPLNPVAPKTTPVQHESDPVINPTGQPVSSVTPPVPAQPSTNGLNLGAAVAGESGPPIKTPPRADTASQAAEKEKAKLNGSGPLPPWLYSAGSQTPSSSPAENNDVPPAM